MGYQLNKPDLRREMEHECNLVALGQKTKEEIMNPILAKMRECFDNVAAEVHKLDEAVARHYQRLGSNAGASSVLRANVTRCGICNSLMTLKQAGTNRGNDNNVARRKLLFCGTCSQGYLLPRGEVSAYQDAEGNAHTCPICRFQVVQISTGDGYTGNGYKVCPKCYTDSPLEYGGTASGDHKCFSCTHSTCPLSGGSRGVEAFPCPFCAAQINLKKAGPRYCLGCSSYSATGCNYTVWLPRAASSVSVDDEQYCPRCSVDGKIFRQLKFVWKPGSVPPHLGREYIGCIVCDRSLREDVGIILPQLNQVIPNNRGRTINRATGLNSMTRSSSAGRGRGRGRGSGGATASARTGGNTCYRCGEPGHFASSCPNN